MTASEFAGYRPPDEPRRRRRRDGARPGSGRGRGPRRPGGADGSREMPVVPDAEFTSYYGRPIVKPAPWGGDIAAYLFLGGLAAGSGLLAAGAQLTGRPALRRVGRFAAIGSAGLGTVTLIRDLGRPERFANMLRTIKVTSPMSVGSWLLAGFATSAGVAAAGEVDRMSAGRLPLGPLRPLLRQADGAAGIVAGALAPGLAAYTGVLLSATATPTWNEARDELPFLFAGSAALAAGGLAMIATPRAEAGPARGLALAGVAADLAASGVMERRVDPAIAETLRGGRAGEMLRASQALAVTGGIGTLLAGRSRTAAVCSGAALLAASVLTRFGIFEAGMSSARDPRYTVEPQKRRLERRRAAGITDDSITTAE
ncbi:NrfD/PsrC family molybdoenzyme membrane anchor subunit [Pseudactinotalea sp. HY158]|uniref:NrfD/PsrC family molybdoenzyme membrane anchor subunit n=1 Tax=Pseudactinotalea sp. HY158 TaxID=2654547 RepID=UPI00129C7153|nr:NrfD/PsrC family molybdoenzyme membrane anchor subunit [Pseudactinotalea sp. HY158]QGH70519.1 nitrite reductase [Pseudactinotalea sp. HY158]